MMSAEDVAAVVMFVLTRPRGHRVLEIAFRPVKEESWVVSTQARSSACSSDSRAAHRRRA